MRQRSTTSGHAVKYDEGSPVTVPLSLLLFSSSTVSFGSGRCVIGPRGKIMACTAQGRIRAFLKDKNVHCPFGQIEIHTSFCCCWFCLRARGKMPEVTCDAQDCRTTEDYSVLCAYTTLHTTKNHLSTFTAIARMKTITSI